MFCPTCGNRVDDNLQVCPYCQKELPSVPKKKSGPVKKFFGWLLLILSVMSVSGNLMTTFGSRYVFSALEFLMPSMLFACFLMLLGMKMIDPESDSLFFGILRGVIILFMVLGFLFLLMALLI